MDFRDAEFMSAAEKAKVLRAWTRFCRSGFKWQWFTKALYEHLIQHCSFIAHYNRAGFFGVYFAPMNERTLKFIGQFDPKGNGLSVEYWTDYWWRGGNDVSEQYYDINAAMREAMGPHVEYLREAVRLSMTVQATLDRDQAEERLARLQGGDPRREFGQARRKEGR